MTMMSKKVKEARSLPVILGIKLTKQQKVHYKTFQWLNSRATKDIASGRSTLLALYLIEKAILHPGIRIAICNHTAHTQYDHFLQQQIAGMISKLEGMAFEFFPVDNRFAFIGYHKVYNKRTYYSSHPL